MRENSLPTIRSPVMPFVDQCEVEIVRRQLTQPLFPTFGYDLLDVTHDECRLIAVRNLRIGSEQRSVRSPAIGLHTGATVERIGSRAIEARCDHSYDLQVRC